jgi:hypothetical protein
MIYVYKDANLTQQMAYNDDSNGTTFSQVKLELEGGKSYYIKLVGYNGGSVHARIAVNQASREFVKIGTNTPVDVTANSYESKYFTFTPSLSGTHRFFTGPYGGTGSSSDTVLHLYSNSSLTTQLAYNDDSNGTLFSEINYGLTAGTTYYIKLRGFNDRSISARFTVSIPPNSPSITSYSDGLKMNDNTPTFTWNYSDLDGNPQAKYQVMGSLDNGVTWSYNSGEVASSATSHTTTALSDGEWDFRIRVFDGFAWSAWSNRNNVSPRMVYKLQM